MNFTALLTIAIPIVILTVIYAIFHGRVYEMDFGPDRGSFFAPYGLYRRLFCIVCITGLPLALLSAYIRSETSAALLTAAAIYAILFNGWMAYVYEGYLHSKYPKNPPRADWDEINPPINRSQSAFYIGRSNYTAIRYATTLTLAFSSLAFFVAGIITVITAVLER